MTLKNIDFKKGKITFDSFNLDYTLPFKDQKWELGEDLLQVKYPKKYLLDVGWLPGFGINGSFVIQIIKNRDWEKPILRKETRSLARLEEYVQQAINLIINLINDKNILIKEKINSNFDRAEFLNFFDEEYIYDGESGAFYYSLELDHGFKFHLYTLAIDKFVSIRLNQETLKSKILDIGFEEITYLKLYKSEDPEWVCLDLYKNTTSPTDTPSQDPSASITIKPNVSVSITLP